MSVYLFLMNAILIADMNQFIYSFSEFGSYSVISEIICPIWHIRYKGTCNCGSEKGGFITCTDNKKLIWLL